MNATTPANVTFHFDHQSIPVFAVDKGRSQGLRHRTVIDGRTGAQTLALWVEEHVPGFVVPPHRHNCEEIISVTRGRIEAQIGQMAFIVDENQSILIPAWAAHGFSVISDTPVRLLAFFSLSDPKNFDMEHNEYTPPWEAHRP